MKTNQTDEGVKALMWQPMKRTLLATLTAWVVASTASAEESVLRQMPVVGFMTGGQLDLYCSSRETFDVGYCVGYVIGIADTLSVQTKRGETYLGYRACMKRGVAWDELVEIVRVDLNDNPQLQRFGASSLVARSLSQAFPCRPRVSASTEDSSG